MNTSEHNRQRQAALVSEKKNTTYAKMVEKYGVNQWYLWQIINVPDYNPPAAVAHKVGYLPTAIPAPPCPTCGGACTYDCGTQRPTALPGTGRKRNRRAINLSDAKSAFETICNAGVDDYYLYDLGCFLQDEFERRCQ